MHTRLKVLLKQAERREGKLKRRLDRIKYAILHSQDLQRELQKTILERQQAHINKGE